MAKFDKNKKIKTKRFVLKRFKLSASIGGYSAGTVISLQCHKVGGTPKERYWRKRLIESKIDGCMTEVVEPKPEKKKKDKQATNAVETVENIE